MDIHNPRKAEYPKHVLDMWEKEKGTTGFGSVFK